MDIKNLIKLLEQSFPVVLYRKGETLEDLAYKAGEQKVIEFIKSKFTQSKVTL